YGEEPQLALADIGRLRQLGWSPAHTLEQGIAETIEWWKSKAPA
ncbi:MAG: hypothetical protein QOJ21_2611, partial [Solirubrobacteraceae bacterium]|nr:hypothetical protein [Solirubrobacteraceae bacterium]